MIWLYSAKQQQPLLQNLKNKKIGSANSLIFNMYKTYITQGQIRVEVPTSFNWDKSYGEHEFNFVEVPAKNTIWQINEQMDLTEGDQGRLYNFAPPDEHDEPSANLVLYLFNYCIGPFLDHDVPFQNINQSYWYKILKTIPRDNFYNSLINNSVIRQYINGLFIIIWYTERLIARIDERFTRPPKSGTEEQGADIIYKPDFNMGYEWKYAQIKIEPTSINNAYIKIKQDKSIIMAKNESGINKAFNTIYPGYSEWLYKGKKRMLWTFDISYILNGSYWLMRTEPETIPPVYEWKDKSYCYMSRSFQAVIFYDPVDGITVDIKEKTQREYSNQTAYYHNVGTNWDTEYTPDNIPAQYRIWREENGES